MRAVTEIRADIAAELARHQALIKPLERELSEALGKRHNPDRVEQIGNDWRRGVPSPEIMRHYRLTKGQLLGLVHRHGWQRPYVPLKTMAAEQFAKYRSLRHGRQWPRVDAEHVARAIPAKGRGAHQASARP